MSNKKKGNASGAKGKAKEDDWDSILEAEIEANKLQARTAVPPPEVVAPNVSDAHSC